MIHVQLSSKMWHKQLFFICFLQGVIELCARYYSMTAKEFWLIREVKDRGAVLHHKTRLEIFAVFGDKSAER